MELERDVLVSPTGEVPVIEGELVTAIRTLAERGVGKKTIAREVGVAVNTVRRYLRQPIEAGVQVRPAARRLTDEWRQEARALYEGPAPAMRSSSNGSWASGGSPSAFARLSARWSTSGVSSASPSSRRYAWKRYPAISSKLISARSGCRLPACACASSCWSPYSATRGACS